MSDTAETTTTETTETTDTDAPDLPAEVEKWKGLAHKHEKRAKDNAEAAKQLEQFKQQSMTDTEKAIEQARAEARADALAESGGKVAKAELRAAAAGRLDAEALDMLLDGINLAKFLDEDGEVDAVKVQAFMDGIAPKSETTTAVAALDLGQGARGNNHALNGDPLEQSLKAKLGIK